MAEVRVVREGSHTVWPFNGVHVTNPRLQPEIVNQISYVYMLDSAYEEMLLWSVRIIFEFFFWNSSWLVKFDKFA